MGVRESKQACFLPVRLRRVGDFYEQENQTISYEGSRA